MKSSQDVINKSEIKHGIVIPCYNESSRLDLNTFIDFAKQYKHVSLCFVNDGSADMTRATLANIKNLVSENVYICNVAENAGKANAVRTGSWYLFNETDVDTIGFLDADLSTSFEDYHILTEAFLINKNKKVIFGSRNMSGDGSNIERNPIRKLLSDFIRMLILMITHLKINDTQCGAKVFHRSLIPFIYSEEFCSKWLFDVEILLRLKKKYGVENFRNLFLEQPLNNWVHMEGSKLGMKDSIMIPINLMDIWTKYNFIPALKKKLTIFRRIKSGKVPLLSKIQD